MPCQMALDNQLSTSELDLLFHNLEQELVKKNPRANYNYGLVLDHVGNQTKAIHVLQIAMDLGVAEARAALSRILAKGVTPL